MIKLCQWDITGNCNLNCTYCREKDLAELPDLPLNQICQIIDELQTLETQAVNLAGGEPLTFKLLPQVLKYMRDKVKRIGITTNGTLITDKNLQLIKKYVNGVQVSLDGSCAEIHDTTRGKGNFKRTIAGIKKLVAAGVYTVTRLTITELNLHDTGAYVELAKTLGVQNAYLRRVIPVGNASDFKPLSAEILKESYRLAFETGKKIGLHVGSTDYFSQLYFDDKERAKADKNLAERPNRLLSGCSMGIDAFYIAQDGKVMFCPFLPVFCGDLTKQSLAEIWKDSEMFKVSRSLRWNVKGKCSQCKYLMCCGGCPAYIYLTTGQLTGSDNGCWIVA